jgi:hypothetical protein
MQMESLEGRKTMEERRTSMNDFIKSLVETKDKEKIRQGLIGLRWDNDLSDNDFFQAFALVTMTVLNQRESQPVHDRPHEDTQHGDPLAVVEAVLSEDECDYKRNKYAVKTGFRGEHCDINIFVVKPDDSVCMLFDVPVVIKVPKEAEPNVTKTITSINWKHALGAFHYNLGSGEVSFRIALPLPGGVLPCREQVGMCLLVCCQMADRYYPDIARACWG